MCGVFGWALDGEKVRPEQRGNAFKVLAEGNDKRGGHSYGTYAVDHKIIYRGLGKLAEARYPRKDKPVKSVRLIAHTRFATHGKASVDNAHPFVVGTVTGVHNGIIHNHEKLNREYGRSFEVDSQHIFAHLNEGRKLGDLEGYGTICFTDAGVQEGQTIFLGTFGGDLSVARLTRGGGVVWSSDENHLRAALKAMGTPFEMLLIENTKLYQIIGQDIYKTGKTLDVKEEKYCLWDDVQWGKDWRAYWKDDEEVQETREKWKLSRKVDRSERDEEEVGDTCCLDPALGCFPNACYCECAGCVDAWYAREDAKDEEEEQEREAIRQATQEEEEEMERESYGG